MGPFAEGVEERESEPITRMNAKELLEAARDAAEARSGHVMCDLLWNVLMLPEAGAEEAWRRREEEEALRILRRRGYTKKMRAVLAKMVAPCETVLEDVSSLSHESGLSGVIKWTTENGPLPDNSDISMKEQGLYSVQEQDALKKMFNLTAVRLWMPAGVHQRIDLARDIESGSMFEDLQGLKMVISLVRSFHAASCKEHIVDEVHDVANYHTDVVTANQSFVALIASAKCAPAGMCERLVHAYLAEARMRALQPVHILTSTL